ncbi:MAG: hypothetical protein ACLPX1_12160 [Steroidobacteraceae bacterium]
MRYFTSVFVLGVTTLGALSGCGGGSGGYYGNGGGGPPPLVSYVGTTGVFVAWADPISGNFAAAPIGSYAGKKQVMRGTVDFQSGTNLSQPAGIEVYKGSDGHIYGLNLAAIGMPAGEQLSSEAAATVDDVCTLPGTQVAGADYDYIGVYFAADLQTTTNSSYIYRLPGPDGVCNTADDIFHMVKTGMASTDAPIIVSGMPVATVRTAQGGISGFVVKSGATLQLVDSNFANPAVLGTFAAPIGVAVALPVGTTQGYPTGQLYVVDGNIVYVNYAARTVSGTLYSIPNWIPTNPEALFAASPTTLYFSVNTPAVGVTPAHATIFAMPADGSAMPSAVDTEPGRIATLLFPVQGANLLWGVVNSTYAIRTLPAAGGASTTLVNSAENDGTFIATASTIYYETWAQSFDTSTNTLTRSGTQCGIVGVNGSLIQAPLANSTFVNGGQQQPWPDDTTTTATAYQTLFQVQGLSPVTVTNAITGEIYVEDGVSGGTLIAIDAGSNQPVTTIGQLPVSTATTLNGTFRDASNTGFLEAENALSTQDPATRDLYLFDSQATGSLSLLTDNL